MHFQHFDGPGGSLLLVWSAEGLVRVELPGRGVASQRRGVMAAVDLVPIHPGLAKYMREKGVWDAKWDSRVAKQ